MSMRSFVTILSVILCELACIAQAELHPTGPATRGGGTVQGCDTSLHVGFSGVLTGLYPYDYVFTPDVTPGSTVFTGSVWSYYIDPDLYQLDGGVPLSITFPGAGDYPICLTVNALDAITQEPCSTTTCDLFQPLEDSSCVSLVPDFTISAISGPTVTFVDQSDFASSIEGTYWTFGDGMSTAEVTPSHTFYGPGPFEVCLTVVGPGPVYCTATICKWLYLGPIGVECGVVLDQGFIFLQQENLVGVLDTSFTAGMNRQITWDFGDGYTAEGNVAVHAYPMGAFELCSTIRVWGILVSDTCSSTMCRTVDALPTTMVQEEDEPGSIRSWPNPFNDELTFVGLASGITDIRVHDAGGRQVYAALAQVAGGFMTLNLQELAPGPYTVHFIQGDRRHTERALKR